MKRMTLNPQRFGGSYLIDEDGSETIIVNYNSWSRNDAEQRASIISTARSVEMTWWAQHYTMWLMLRPAGGEWMICPVRPWEQPLSVGKKSKLILCVTDASDNGVMASATYDLPEDCADRLSTGLEDIWENCMFPPEEAKRFDWVREYLDNADIKASDLLDRCDRVYQISH